MPHTVTKHKSNGIAVQFDTPVSLNHAYAVLEEEKRRLKEVSSVKNRKSNAVKHDLDW